MGLSATPQPNVRKTKTAIGLGLLAIIGIGVGIIVVNKDAHLSDDQAASTSKVGATIEGVNNGINNESATSPNKTLSYKQAFDIYGSRRITFGSNCQTALLQPTYKAGTNIMLDNRSDESIAILFNKTPYTLSAHGFRFIALGSAKTIKVACTTSEANASVTLTVQK